MRPSSVLQLFEPFGLLRLAAFSTYQPSRALPALKRPNCVYEPLQHLARRKTVFGYKWSLHLKMLSVHSLTVYDEIDDICFPVRVAQVVESETWGASSHS